MGSLRLLARGLRRQPRGRPAAEGLNRGRRQGHPVPLPQQGPRARHRQVLRMAQVDHQRLQAGTELHWPGRLRREGRPRADPAARTADGLRPVLGHRQGRRRRQVVHLAPRRDPGRRAGQGRTAAAAPRRPVVNMAVGLLRRHLAAGGPRMARLAAPRPALAAGARRSRRTVLRGRLAAVAVVTPQLPPQIRQFLVLRRHPRPQRDQLALHGRQQPRPPPDGRPGQGRRPQGPDARRGTGRTWWGLAQCGTTGLRPPNPAGPQAQGDCI